MLIPVLPLSVNKSINKSIKSINKSINYSMILGKLVKFSL